ncbi:MAG: efflux RND transporter permease subunit, partial [Sediminispirochaetaceae bacterium]
MRILYRHPWLNIIVIIFISLFFTVQIPDTTLDNDVMNFIPEEHPEAKAYKRTSDLFGSSMILGVGIEFTNATIFEPDHTALIRRLTDQFEQLRYVESVLSLSNTDYIEGTPEGMTVNPLIGENFEGSDRDIRDLKLRLADWPIYRNVLYSDDFTAAQILVTFEEDLEAEQREELYFTIKEVLDSEKRVPFRYYLAGNPAITVLVTDNMKADMATLIPMVVVVVLAALYISFRRIGGVVISMLTVLLSTIWTVGAMALLRVPLSMVATVIPVLMIAVGSAYGIHIISHYYDEIDLHPDGADPETHRDIIFRTMHKIGRPVLLAGLTTIAGFGALSTSRVIPMRNFGIFTAFGVLAAVIVALIFIPSLLLVRRRTLKPAGSGGENPDPAAIAASSASASSSSAEHKIIMALYHFFSRHKMNILL